MPMPCTTALVKSLAVKAAAAGITPAIAVVMNSASVVAGLASHTNLRTRGKAAVVPVTDCLKLSHLPRRSLGPSCTGVGLLPPSQPPVDHRRPAPRPHHSHRYCSLPTGVRNTLSRALLLSGIY